MNPYADKFPLNTLVINFDYEESIGWYRGRMGLDCGSSWLVGKHAIQTVVGGTIYVDPHDLRELDFREVRLLGLDS